MWNCYNKPCENESVSNFIITNNSPQYNVDASKSTHKCKEVGGVSGFHRWFLSGNRNTVDVLASGTPITMIANANVTINGNNFEKSITGNSWNSSGYSQESFDPLNQDFAFTWAVESITGTIREMGGLDNNPTQNNSYTSLEHAIYQVSGNFYNRVYETGAQKVTNMGNIPLSVGDRLGIRVETCKVTYFILRGSIITDVYVSEKELSVPVQFKTSLNRGTSSSGASVLGDIQYHTVTKPESFFLQFDGYATDLISDEDKERIKKEAGLTLQSGSTYSNWQFERDSIDRFSNQNIDIKHVYIGDYNTSMETVNF